jgi:hypothetical protein
MRLEEYSNQYDFSKHNDKNFICNVCKSRTKTIYGMYNHLKNKHHIHLQCEDGTYVEKLLNN